MIDKDKIIHDLAMLYALANYLEAKRENSDTFKNGRQKYGLAYETDFIHSLYMEALGEYSNYDDESFDLDNFFKE